MHSIKFKRMKCFKSCSVATLLLHVSVFTYMYLYLALQTFLFIKNIIRYYLHVAPGSWTYMTCNRARRRHSWKRQLLFPKNHHLSFLLTFQNVSTQLLKWLPTLQSKLHCYPLFHSCSTPYTMHHSINLLSASMLHDAQLQFVQPMFEMLCCDIEDKLLLHFEPRHHQESILAEVSIIQ